MILSDRGQGSVQNCTQQKAGHAYVCVDGLSLSLSFCLCAYEVTR